MSRNIGRISTCQYPVPNCCTCPAFNPLKITSSLLPVAISQESSLATAPSSSLSLSSSLPSAAPPAHNPALTCRTSLANQVHNLATIRSCLLARRSAPVCLHASRSDPVCLHTSRSAPVCLHASRSASTLADLLQSASTLANLLKPASIIASLLGLHLMVLNLMTCLTLLILCLLPSLMVHCCPA